jgi:hypothetical protein
MGLACQKSVGQGFGLFLPCTRYRAERGLVTAQLYRTHTLIRATTCSLTTASRTMDADHVLETFPQGSFSGLDTPTERSFWSRVRRDDHTAPPRRCLCLCNHGVSKRRQHHMPLIHLLIRRFAFQTLSLHSPLLPAHIFCQSHRLHPPFECSRDGRPMSCSGHGGVSHATGALPIFQMPLLQHNAVDARLHQRIHTCHFSLQQSQAFGDLDGNWAFGERGQGLGELARGLGH